LKKIEEGKEAERNGIPRMQLLIAKQKGKERESTPCI